MLLAQVGQLEDVVEVDDVGTVEVGGAVAVAEVEGVVAVVEEAEAALLVEGVGVGVGSADLEAVAHALFEVSVEGVVGVDAGGFVVDGLGGVADVGDAMVDVAAFVVGVIVGAAGESGSADGVAVGVFFAVDGVGGVGDAGLVEGDGDDLVTAEVADVTELDGDGRCGLPLDVERVVVGVGKLVVAVVDAERDGLAAVVDGSEVGKILAEVRRLGAGGDGVADDLR